MIGHRKQLVARAAVLGMAALLALLTACGPGKPKLDTTKLKEFASSYAAAWSSHDPARVAANFSPTGSMKINDGEPAVGRVAIAAQAQRFMSDFPDLSMKMEEVSLFEGDLDFHWTLTGKNSGPGGTGKLIQIGGYEDWNLGADGLIASAARHYDEAEFQRQLKVGYTRPH